MKSQYRVNQNGLRTDCRATDNFRGPITTLDLGQKVYLTPMLHLELQPQTEARVTAAAQRRGLSVDALVEEFTNLYLSDEDGLLEGLDDIAQGRTRPAREVFAELHEQYGIRG